VDEDRLKRHDLSDAEWARLEPLLPRHPRQGHRWNDHRLVINGLFFRTRTGCPWRDLPERSGTRKTVYNRHRRWSADGTWEMMILGRLRAGCDEAAGPGWIVAADATVGRAHQHAPGTRRAPPADVDPARLAPDPLSDPLWPGGAGRGRPGGQADQDGHEGALEGELDDHLCYGGDDRGTRRGPPGPRPRPAGMISHRSAKDRQWLRFATRCQTQPLVSYLA
jgi:transposase